MLSWLSNCAFYSDQTTKLIKIIWSFISFKYHLRFSLSLVVDAQWKRMTLIIINSGYLHGKHKISGVAIPIMWGGGRKVKDPCLFFPNYTLSSSRFSPLLADFPLLLFSDFSWLLAFSSLWGGGGRSMSPWPPHPMATPLDNIQGN